jgi:hypothetical protein
MLGRPNERMMCFVGPPFSSISHIVALARLALIQAVTLGLGQHTQTSPVSSGIFTPSSRESR